MRFIPDDLTASLASLAGDGKLSRHNSPASYSCGKFRFMSRYPQVDACHLQSLMAGMYECFRVSSKQAVQGSPSQLTSHAVTSIRL